MEAIIIRNTLSQRGSYHELLSHLFQLVCNPIYIRHRPQIKNISRNEYLMCMVVKQQEYERVVVNDHRIKENCKNFKYEKNKLLVTSNSC